MWLNETICKKCIDKWKTHYYGGKCFWYIGHPLEALSFHIYLNPDNVNTIVKATVVVHNILTLPNDKVHTDVVDNRAEIFDYAFEDLAKQGNWPATAANNVRNYFTDYFNSDHGSFEWQNDCT